MKNTHKSHARVPDLSKSENKQLLEEIKELEKQRNSNPNLEEMERLTREINYKYYKIECNKKLKDQMSIPIIYSVPKFINRNRFKTND